jgi:hypothetical protein
VVADFDAGGVWSLVGDELAEGGLEVIASLPSCTVSVSGATQGTVGDTLQLTAEGLNDPAATYLWTIESGPGEIVGANDEASVSVRGTAAGDVEVRVQAGQPDCTAMTLDTTITFAPSGAPVFVRGDVDASGEINITDAIFLLGYLFQGTTTPSCMDAADVDDLGAGAPNITDAIFLLGWLFQGTAPPPAPVPTTDEGIAGAAYDPVESCGSDPSAAADPDPDGMSCVSFTPCGN